MRRLIIILLLLLAVAGGFLMGIGEFYFAAAILLVSFLLVMAEFVMRFNFLYPFLVLIAALYIPLKISTGRSTPLVLSLILATGFTFLWLFEMLMEKRFKIRSARINLPLLLFSIEVIISLFWGIAFRDPFINVWGSFPLVQAASALLIIISLATVLLTGNLITTEKQLQWIVGIFLVAGVLGILDNFFSFIRLPVNTRGLFAMWVVAISTSMALFIKKMSIWLRIGLVLLASAWFYWGFGMNIAWLAGWISLIAVFMAVSLFRSWKLALGIVFLILIFIAIRWNYLMEVINIENQISGSTRLFAWGVNWRITKDHLLFGTGPAGYAIYYMTYFPTQAMATHNNYLDMISQTGLVGFVLMMWFFISLVWMGWQVLRRARGRGDFIEALSAACLAGTLGGLMMMIFGDWLFPFAYTQTIAGFDYSVFNWIFMGVILSLDQLTTPKEVESHA